jgi:hypothetical protein
MIYNGNGAEYPKYGIMNTNQIVPVEFDANFYNYGTATQTNAALEVEIWDVTNTPTIVQTLTAPTCASLAPLDTCDFSTSTTAQWTPPAQEASYLIVYKAISDSIPSASTTTTDTFSFFVNDALYGVDRNEVSNFVGSNSANGGLLTMGVMYSLENEDPDSTGSGLVFIDGMSVLFSTATDPTADIEFAIWDTAGFAYNAGFPPGTTPIFRRAFTLDPSVKGANIAFPFSTPDSIWDDATETWTATDNPLAIPAGTYFFTMDMFPSAADSVIRIANDASFDQPLYSTIMQTGDGSWFGGFTSDVHEGTFLRLNVAEAPAWNISIKENEQSSFNVYPNPTNGQGFISFTSGGSYDINVLDMVGNIVVSQAETVNANQRVELDLSNLSAGVYLVNVKGEGTDRTIKLTVK